MRSRLARIMRRDDSRRARGTAIVEFAVVLPLLLFILFGIIEFGYVFMVRQTLQHAAREGCRMAILQTSTDPYTNVQMRIAEIMATTNASSYTVQMTHATVADPSETIVTSVPYYDVRLMGGYLGLPNFTLRGTCVMRKEGM